MKRKITNKHQGSVLVFSLIILFIILTSALAIGVTTVIERKNSLTSNKSTQGFSMADSAVELVNYQLRNAASLTDLASLRSALATATGQTTTCISGSGSSPAIISGSMDGTKTYSLSFYDSATPTPALITSCSDVTAVSKISKVKAVGSFGNTTRAIEAPLRKTCNAVLSQIPLPHDTISTCEQLQCYPQENLAGSYTLSNDIDCSATNPANSGNKGSLWDNGGIGFTPIGDAIHPFTGILDGSHEVSNLYMNQGLTVGLFSHTSGATIKNIGLRGIDVKTDFRGNGVNGAAGIVGHATNSTNVSNVYVTGSIVAKASGSGANGIGGIVGILDKSTIKKSYAKVDLSFDAGGGGSNNVGGLVGIANQCWPLGCSGSSIADSYSTGNLVLVTGGGGSNIKGGLIAVINSASVSSSYWDTETSNQATSAGGTGKTTAQMKLQPTFAGWDFATPIWKIIASVNNGYPCLNGVTPSCN